VKSSERKRPLGRTIRRWDYNIKTDGREIELGVTDFIDLAENRDQWMCVVNTVINLRLP
jgi:hypothetical protein